MLGLQLWCMGSVVPGLKSRGSEVVVHLLGCPLAWGGLPRPGIKSVSPVLAGGVLDTQPPVNLTPLGTSHKWSHNVFVPL